MSLTEQYVDDNIFTKIIAGDIPSIKLFEDNDVLAFMDAFPQSEGHALIISKTAQSVNLLDMPEGALTKVILQTQKIARAVNQSLNPDGIRIIQFNGMPAGQTVFHTHFHVIPVYEGHTEKPHGSSPADTEYLETIAAKITASL